MSEPEPAPSPPAPDRERSHFLGKIHLTDGEREVLLDIAVGLTDQAIADRLALSRRGVQNRLASIYRKLGVHRSAQAYERLPCAPRCRAVFLALHLGLIQSTDLDQRESVNRDWAGTHTD